MLPTCFTSFTILKFGKFRIAEVVIALTWDVISNRMEVTVPFEFFRLRYGRIGRSASRRVSLPSAGGGVMMVVAGPVAGCSDEGEG